MQKPGQADKREAPSNIVSPPPRPRVLLVEDEPVLRAHLVASLGDEFTIDTASDGEQALVAVLRVRPDLIVTDIVMPTLDGVELVRLLRETPSTATIPILLTSGRAPDDVRIEGFEVGADSYLAKPYSERELRARIRAMLQIGHRRDHAARSEALERTAVERATLLENISDCFYALDELDRFTYLNQRALDFFGKTASELIGKIAWEFVPGGADSVFVQAFDRALRERTSVSFEATTADGRWLDVHAFPGVNGLAVNFREITERKREEAILRDSEFHFRAVADAVPVLMWRTDTEIRGTWFNKTWLEFTGRGLAKELGFGWSEVVHPDDLDQAKSNIQACLDQRLPLEIEFRMRRRDGEYRWMLDRGNPVYEGPDGAFSGYIGTCIDITDLRRSSDALQAAEQRYRAFVANSTEAIWRYELDEPLDLQWQVDRQLEHVLKHAHLAELNDAMARMHGFDRAEDMLGMPLARILTPDDPEARAYLQRVVESGFTLADVESHEKDRDGREHSFSNSITPVVEDGRVLRTWGTRRDITDRKRAEERMKEAERRKDEFVATLAHELRNPLSPIRNGIHVLKTRLPPSAETGEVLQMMDRQMTHMVRLLDDLLDVSRISRGRLELKREVVNLRDALAAATESTVVLLQERRHTLELDIPHDDILVDGDPTRLTQIFANLISNSAKYTEPAGKIKVSLARQGHEAVVSVVDTGIGIPPQAIDRVFEMFSQVRLHQEQTQAGLGIGLSVVKTLVQMHGGSVSVMSDGPGKGSTFRVRLPIVVAQEAESGRSADTAQLNSPRTPLRILVVDDNRDAALSLAMILEAESHSVQTAFAGEEAVAHAASFRPDLIFMDVGMPVVDGYEATRRIRALRLQPRPTVVALTGWGQEADRRRSSDAGMDEHLVKPVDAEAMQATIERTISSKANR